jgi:hypothetical protein
MDAALFLFPVPGCRCLYAFMPLCLYALYAFPHQLYRIFAFFYQDL